MSHVSVVLRSSSAPTSPAHYRQTTMSGHPTRTPATTKLYTTGVSSSKASSASIKHKINQRQRPHTLASFEEAVQRETYARCLADLSMRSSRDTGIPRLYSSQRLSSPKYPSFERSLSSSQLPRGDYGYIRSVTRTSSNQSVDSSRYGNQFASNVMVRQHSEPGISSVHLRKTTSDLSKPKASRSIEALVSPTSKQSKLVKPSKTRTSHSLEAINEPTGGRQTLKSHLVARLPKKSSESGKKKEATSQHTVVKLSAKNKTSTSQQVNKKNCQHDHKSIKKSTSVDDRLCSGGGEKDKSAKKSGPIPKAKIVNMSQTQSRPKKDQAANEAVVRVPARSPDGGKIRVKETKAGIKPDSKERRRPPSRERSDDRGGIKQSGVGKDKKTGVKSESREGKRPSLKERPEESTLTKPSDDLRRKGNNDKLTVKETSFLNEKQSESVLKEVKPKDKPSKRPLQRTNAYLSESILASKKIIKRPMSSPELTTQHRNQSNSKQSDDERRRSSESITSLDLNQSSKRASATKIPITSNVVGQLMSRNIVPDDMVLQDGYGVYKQDNGDDTADSAAVSNQQGCEQIRQDMEGAVPPEIISKSDSQDLFSGLDMSCAIDKSDIQERLSPPRTLRTQARPFSAPSSPVKLTKRDSIRREKVDFVFETNPPRLSLKKQVSFDIGMSIMRQDGSMEKSSYRTMDAESIDSNDKFMFGSMFGWKESPTNSEGSFDSSDAGVDDEAEKGGLSVLPDHAKRKLSIVQEVQLSPEEIQALEASERKLERGRRGSDRRKTLPTKEAQELKSPDYKSRSMPGYLNRQKSWTIEKSDKKSDEDSVLKIKLTKPKAFSNKNAKLMDRRKAYAKARSISEGNMFNALNTKANKLGDQMSPSARTSPTARSPLMSPFLGLRRMLSRESGRWSPGTARKNEAKNSNTGSGSPKPKKRRFYGVCRSCGFDVMSGDEISVRQWVYHKDCFKCARCDQSLSLKFFLQRQLKPTSSAGKHKMLSQLNINNVVIVDSPKTDLPMTSQTCSITHERRLLTEKSLTVE